MQQNLTVLEYSQNLKAQWKLDVSVFAKLTFTDIDSSDWRIPEDREDINFWHYARITAREQ